MDIRASLDVLEENKKKSLAPARNQTPENPVHSLAYVQIVLCQLPIIHT
jgi:hypothetical protein